jgi:hypothetical protein
MKGRMKMKRTIRIIWILTLIATLIGGMLACKVDGDPDGTATPRPPECYIAPDGSLICRPPSWEAGIQATETYGAEEWQAQLTAVASPEE